MLRIIILGLILTGCKGAQPIKYFWETHQKRDFIQRVHVKRYKPNTPHYIPIPGDKVSNDLVFKYNYLYNIRRYGLYKKNKR